MLCALFDSALIGVRSVLLAATLLCVTSAAHADLVVPAAGSVGLNGGSVDLGCSDVVVAGTLALQGGTLVNVRNLSIAAGGVIVAGSGSITLSGNWANAGTFTAGTGAVNFVDAPGCSVDSTVSGNNTFATLTLISTSGKRYQFAGGSTQAITQQLTLSGTAALPIRVQSATPGQSVFFNLSGQQTMNAIAATDMVAIGTWIAPNLVNRNPTGATIGWFGDPFVPVPTLNQSLLIALTALLMLIGVRSRRRNDRVTKSQNV